MHGMPEKIKCTRALKRLQKGRARLVRLSSHVHLDIANFFELHQPAKIHPLGQCIAGNNDILFEISGEEMAVLDVLDLTTHPIVASNN
jgi:hypothetical protein